MAKKKKEKVVYYDDNSTVADMSSVTRSGKKEGAKAPQAPRASVGTSKWQTYWQAVKMMFVPMLFALGVIGATFLLIMAFTGNLF